MEMNEETQEQLQKMQVIDQNLQNILMQKQAFQMELSETENALKEVSKSRGDIFKVIGQVMLKTNKPDMEKDLKEKNKLLGLRMKAVEKQEAILREQVERIRGEVIGKIEEK